MIRKTSTLFVISLVAAIALCLPALTYALTGGNAEQNGSQCPMNQFFYKFFNITPEQQAALEKVRQDTDAQIKPYMDQIKPLEDQLQATLLAENIDTAKATELFNGITDIEAQINPIEGNAQVAAAQILTSEQRADIQGVMTDITSFIKYILQYPDLNKLRNKYGDRLLKAMLDTRLKFLNLTDEQKTALINLRNKTLDAIKPIAEQIGPLHEELATTLLAATIDTNKASDLINQMVQPTSEIATIGFNAQVAAAQILTPEQRQILLEKLKQMENTENGWGEDRI